MGILVMFAGVGWLVFPRATVKTSPIALAQVQLGGVNAHMTNASVDLPGGTSVALVDRQNQLWPTRLLPSGVPVQLNLTIQGPNWLPPRVFHQTVMTPGVPRLTNPDQSVTLGNQVKLNWSESVVAVQTLKPGTWSAQLSQPSTLVTLGPAQSTPGTEGTWYVQAQARSWEAPGPVQAVQWHTIPWLTASLSIGTATRGTGSSVGTSSSGASKTTVLPTSPVTVRWSMPLSQANPSQWVMTPAVPGQWIKDSSTNWTFHPSGSGWAPDTPITLTLPGGPQGPRAASGSYLQQDLQLSWRISQATTLRLQQWLAELGYLPVTWTPAAGVANPTTWSSAYQPPAGSFSWRFNNTPTPLTNLWQTGWWNVVTQGAVMQFEHQHGLTVDGIAGPQVWTALKAAVLANQVNTTPYSYVYVSETQPETLWLWQNGQIILTTKANTGVTGALTKLGTHPVFERLPFQVMKGRNPNGQSYADPVSWINYFWGSDAVHGFVRASYGFPQSAGCVELPPSVAHQAYLNLHYGSLVTVMPPGSQPLVAPSASTSTSTSTSTTTTTSASTSQG